MSETSVIHIPAYGPGEFLIITAPNLTEAEELASR